MSEKKNLFQDLDGYVEIEYKPLGKKGEDALACNFRRSDMHTQAVFDGCGGAGAWKYPEFDYATGAFISAQIISRTYYFWFKTIPENDNINAEVLAKEFHDQALGILGLLKKRISPMGVSGSLVKSFPCTASIAIISRDPEDDESLLLTALNCGDSRVYFLTPDYGLVQLTVDDSRGQPDPLESLRKSPSLSDMINADKDFSVKSRQISLKMPFAVICASDGVFGYVRSPMDFELMMLDCLMKTKTFSEFEGTFREEILSITGDDATCNISFYGWGGYEKVQKELFLRYEYVKSLCDMIDKFQDPVKANLMIDRIWKEYKSQTVYDELML